MNLLKKVWVFFLRPKYQTYTYPATLQRRVFLNLLGWNIAIAMGVGFLIELIREALGVDVGTHGMNRLFGQYHPLGILAMAVVLAPVLEESLFRGPLILFKKSIYFAWALYTSIFLFGLVHLFNFEGYQNALWFAPLLFLPQLITGVFLSYIRVRMGLGHAMLFHALFNLILLGPFVLVELLNPSAN